MRLEMHFTEKHGVEVRECSTIFVDDEHLNVDGEELPILGMIESVRIDGATIWTSPLPEAHRGFTQKTKDVYEKFYGNGVLERAQITRMLNRDRNTIFVLRDLKQNRPFHTPFKTLDEAIDAWEMATEH